MFHMVRRNESGRHSRRQQTTKGTALPQQAARARRIQGEIQDGDFGFGLKCSTNANFDFQRETTSPIELTLQ